MTGDEYLAMIDRKYAQIDRDCNRMSAGGNSLVHINDAIPVSGKTGIGKKFKNTLRKTAAFFSKMKISYGIDSRKKRDSR